MNGNYLRWALVGSVLVSIATSLWGPGVIAWYFETPVYVGINCRPAAEWAMARLQWVQILGIFGGALLGIAVRLFFRKSKTPSNV